MNKNTLKRMKCLFFKQDLNRSSPESVSVVDSLDTLESWFPMLVTQWVSNSIHLDSCWKQVSVKSVSIKISEWDQKDESWKPHPFSDFLVWISPTTSSVHEDNEVSDIIGHLWSWSWCSILKIKHSVVKLSWHTNNHMIEVRVEMFSFWNIHSIWGFEMITSHDVVNIVDSSWSESDLEEISWPDTSVGVFGLILWVVGCVHMVVNISVSFIPFLIIILFEVLMSWMDSEMFSNPTG